MGLLAMMVGDAWLLSSMEVVDTKTGLNSVFVHNAWINVNTKRVTLQPVSQVCIMYCKIGDVLSSTHFMKYVFCLVFTSLVLAKRRIKGAGGFSIGHQISKLNCKHAFPVMMHLIKG